MTFSDILLKSFSENLKSFSENLKKLTEINKTNDILIFLFFFVFFTKIVGF